MKPPPRPAETAGPAPSTPADAVPAPARRKARETRTRAALLDAGARLLAERPMAALAIDDIVEAAGVAKGSFYNHFADKAAFGRTLQNNLRSEIERIVDAANENVEDPAARVVHAFCVYIDYILSGERRALMMLRMGWEHTSADNPLNSGVLSDVVNGLRIGRFAVPSVEAGVLLVLGVCQIALVRAVEMPDRARMALIAQQLSSLMLRGLGLSPDAAEKICALAVHELIERR